jgi:hypothetical protein
MQFTTEDVLAADSLVDLAQPFHALFGMIGLAAQSRRLRTLGSFHDATSFCLCVHDSGVDVARHIAHGSPSMTEFINGFAFDQR